ncbi:hypothetical protein [Nocardioides conyzicola]
MGTTDVLHDAIQHTQGRLRGRLADARSMGAARDRPRDGHERIDAFLAITSRHLHAVDAVLLPPTRRQVVDGGSLVHDYLRSSKALEVVLVHVKAHEYGSVYERPYGWTDVWADVATAMADQHRHEQVLGSRLTATLPDDDLDALAHRLVDVELTAPSRPHPYTPHTGALGAVARRVMHAVDGFWDAAEGRMVPGPVPEPKKRPGRMGQYLLADPRFDEEAPDSR